MPIVVKKVRRLGGGGGGGMSGGDKGGSPLRPEFVEKTPGCAKACPNHHDVRAAVMTIAQAEARGKSLDAAFEEAFYILAEKNPLPASISRACPHQCEDQCIRTYLDAPVSINALERFIGDFAVQKQLPLKRATDEHHPEQVAVVGSGPAALSCAYQLVRRGYPVTVLEAFAKPGGTLRYGIPPHRAPREILEAEIARLQALGVEIQCNVAVGKDVAYEELRSRYAAIFVGIRAGWEAKLDLPGADAKNVLSAIEFLHRVNAGEPFAIGASAVVVGGGDVALDAARVAVRLGARTTLVFRKPREEMPVAPAEVEEAEREGVHLECRATPAAVTVEGEAATGLRCVRAGDAGEEFFVVADTIIVAAKPERDTAGLAALCGPDGHIATDPAGETNVSNTFVAGDDLELGIGAAALFRGRRAAEVIHARFRGLPLEPAVAPPAIEKDRLRLDHYPKQPRGEQATVAVAERLAEPIQEVALPIGAEQVVAEAKRCLSCGLCFACDTCWKYCQEQAIVRPAEKGQAYRIKLEFCTGCKKCAEECPCGYIDMR